MNGGNNTVARLIAVIVLIVAVGIMWWYVRNSKESVAPVAKIPSAPAVVPAVSDSAGSIQNDFEEIPSGDGLMNETDALGADIKGGL